jgi:hypothetical protein
VETNVSEKLVTSIFYPGGGGRFLRDAVTTYAIATEITTILKRRL